VHLPRPQLFGGLTVERRCQLDGSGTEAVQTIHDRLADVPAKWLAKLEITQDADGGFCIPLRTLLILARKLSDS
jgi:hypothetical protein